MRGRRALSSVMALRRRVTHMNGVPVAGLMAVLERETGGGAIETDVIERAHSLCHLLAGRSLVFDETRRSTLRGNRAVDVCFRFRSAGCAFDVFVVHFRERVFVEVHDLGDERAIAWYDGKDTWSDLSLM